jgi:hypothetical protein
LLSAYFATGNAVMRPQALALASFLVLCLCAAAAASPVSVAGKFAMEGQCASGFYRLICV